MPVLVPLAALGAAAMNALLPSLPALQVAFGVDYRAVQSALTLFLAGAALAQLIVGPVSDAYGRRPLLLGALGVFCLGGVIVALAPALSILVAGRFLQGFGGAASLVLAEAIVVDDGPKATAERRIGHLSAGMAAAIMVAPATGAVAVAALGWRAIAWMTVAMGAALLGICWSRPTSTTARPAVGGLIRAGRGALGLLGSRRFVGQVLCAAFVMANYFCLAAFGPLIAISHLGLSGIEYGVLFGALGIGYVAGNLMSARLHQRLGRSWATPAALLIGASAGAAGAVLSAVGGMAPVSFFAVGSVIAFVTGVVLPAATSDALDTGAASAGAAAGLLNFSIYGIGALATYLVGAWLDPSATVAMAALPIVTLLALGARAYAGWGVIDR